MSGSGGQGGLSVALLFSLLAVCSLFSKAHAHESIGSVSNSIFIVEGRSVNYYISVPPSMFSPLQQLYDDENLLSEYFMEGLTVTAQGSSCGAVKKAFEPALQPSGNHIVRVAYECPEKVKSLTVKSSLFFEYDETHIQFARLSSPENPGKFIYEATVTARNPEFHIEDVETGGGSVWNRVYGFFVLGIEHILTGYDHILFLLSAILVTITLRDTFMVITSFTIAHSVTLALAFLGVVTIKAGIVEPLIALSIVYVAADNILRKNHDRRWIATLLFGLIHGIGFVGALNEITVSREELVISLVSFNLGIETGQIAIAAVFIPAFIYAKKRLNPVLFTRWVSAAILCAGLFWLIERVLA